MRIDLHVGARKTRAVDQRGVIQRIGKQHGAAPGERRQRREVRHIAGAEVQRARRIDEAADEFRQIVFKLCVRARVATQQMRTAAARAIALRTLGYRGDQQRVRSEAEIVIAGKADHFTAIDHHMRGAGRVSGTAAATQTVRVEIL